MWRYVYTDELYHYGVKGMKWGVRRELGRKAKTAGYLGNLSYRYDKKIKRRIKARDKKGDYKDFRNAEIEKLIRKRDNATELRNKLVSDLSKEDIFKGALSAFDFGLDIGIIFGPFSPAALSVALPTRQALYRSRTKKYANQYGIRNPLE